MGDIYLIPEKGKPIIVKRDKLSIKSRTAIGASISVKNIKKVI